MRLDTQLDDRAENAALGKPYVLAPAPNYEDTRAGDRTDLSDGVIVDRQDGQLWLDRRATCWQFQPLVRIAIDLGEGVPIREIGMRAAGGSKQPYIDYPTSVRALVSDDGVSWRKVGDYDDSVQGSNRSFGVPLTAGTGWVHPLRFPVSGVIARWVCLEIAGTGLTCIDEVWALRQARATTTALPEGPAAVRMLPAGPQPAFLRESMAVLHDLATPCPLLLLDETGRAGNAVLGIELPVDIDLVAVEIDDAEVQASATAMEGGVRRWEFPVKVTGNSKIPWGRMYLRSNGRQPTKPVRCELRPTDRAPSSAEFQVRAVSIAPAPRLKRMVVAMAWWRAAESLRWPGALAAAEALGINTFSTLEDYLRIDDESALELLETARGRGFKIMNVFSAFHGIVERHGEDTEVFCQGPAGAIGKALCPSYRGKWYEDEMRRVAVNVALIRPDILTTDIELWDWRGPVDCERCVRCIASRKASGMPDWGDWRQQRAMEMWRDLSGRAREAAAARGIGSLELGSYDFRPGQVYQQFWPVDALLAAGSMTNTQASTYTPLRPYHLALVGDECRADRRSVSRTCAIPWLTPGDCGVVGSEQLRCALLECWVNGSKGVHFWSGRYWDGDSLLGLQKAVRAVASCEDIIVEGQPTTRVEAPAGLRAFGMETADAIAVVVADYARKDGGAVSVHVDLPWPATVRDTESGLPGQPFESGRVTISGELGSRGSVIFEIRKAEN